MNTEGMADKEVFWSRFAKSFDAGSNYVVGNQVVKAIQDTIARQGTLGQVIELACGTGTYTAELARTSSHVVASDFSGEMLAEAAKKLGDRDNVAFRRINCLDVHFRDNTFDTVFMANLIHVISDPDRVLSESLRILKPGGRILIVSFTNEGVSIFNKALLIYRYLRTWGPPPKDGHPFALAELSNKLVYMGFRIREAFLLGDTMKALFISAEKQ